jgi:hypothetical protein
MAKLKVWLPISLMVDLQYVEDTIVFMKHDIEKARNMKLILSTIEQLSGLKINFHKMNCYFLARLKMNPTCMPSYLAVVRINFLFGT